MLKRMPKGVTSMQRYQYAKCRDEHDKAMFWRRWTRLVNYNRKALLTIVNRKDKSDG